LPCSNLAPRADALVKGGSNDEELLLQMAQRHRRGGSEFCVAGRLWRLQRQRLTNRGVVEYIKSQPEHHKKRNYEEEFLEFLKRYGITYDPAHVLR
jgi:hypothetical protein